MATIICPCVGDAYTSASRSSENWGRDTVYYYGRSVDIGGNAFAYNAYLQFNIAEILRHKVTKLSLVENRYRLQDYQSENIGTIQYSIRSFKSATENQVIVETEITYSNAGQKATEVGNSLSRSSSVTGVIKTDVTSIYDPAHNQNGIYGFRFANSQSTRYISSCYSRESGNGPYLEAEVETLSSKPPTNLLPLSTQNPRGAIALSWWHTANPELMLADPQTAWQLEIIQSGMTTITITQSNTNNQYTLPANSLANYNNVTFRVRTQTQYNGWGEWAQASFTLGTTPPLKSTLVFPEQNNSVSGTNGVPLEWSYNSPHDTFPTRFDVRYRLDGGSWIMKTNYSSGNNPAYQSIMTNPIATQNKVDWQVLAYGQLGDAGPWSEIGTFFTIGVPPTPTIVRVSNSNRPTIFFSAEKLLSWELEIYQDGNKIYDTGNQPFVGEFSHAVSQFFANGNYIVRMRITNEYGLASDWGQLPFAINTVAPPPLKLQIVSNPSFNMRLHFNNTGKTVYIYRSEFRKNNFLRIGVTKGKVYDDYTARPRNVWEGANIRYEYFVRVVNTDYSFADSNIETGALDFIHTTIAKYDSPQDMIKLWKQMDNKPTKDISYDFEKTLTKFVGRERPVLQVGEHSDKSLSLSFHCSIEEYEQLERLHRGHKILLLRDWRLGAVYGTIYGGISASRETEGCIVSFTFVQTDFNEEVELI